MAKKEKEKLAKPKKFRLEILKDSKEKIKVRNADNKVEEVVERKKGKKVVVGEVAAKILVDSGEAKILEEIKQ